MLLVGSKCWKHRYSYGLTNTSSRKAFHNIFSYSGVKKSIKGRSSVGKLDEYCISGFFREELIFAIFASDF